MAKVSIQINGRKYALGCDDGEEERLLRLGQRLDERKPWSSALTSLIPQTKLSHPCG